jgi:hypothetical protein
VPAATSANRSGRGSAPRLDPTRDVVPIRPTQRRRDSDMPIPDYLRGRFHPRDPVDEPRPRPAFPEAAWNIDQPFAETAGRVEREQDALQDAVSRLDGRRTRWEI